MTTGVHDPNGDFAQLEGLLRRLETPAIPLIFRGYDPEAVEALLAEARTALASRSVETSADPAEDVAELIRRVAHAAQLYRQEAEHARDATIEEAEQERERARIDGEGIRARAAVELQDARTEAQALLRAANRELAEARDAAARLRQATTQQLLAARQESEALQQSTTEELRELELLRQDVLRELQSLVTEVVRVIGRYDRAAATSLLALGEEHSEVEVSPALRELLRGAQLPRVPGSASQ